ncbi:ABC transporter substrate-binding protein [Streptomyces yangpuensis]|uniref:ABC transporter substrate-binding protein n=1 Tax=Streptomyces yangpuensis TaxID=1648182 RepID=A0ABY5PWG1_9ACTN|nr:ABC transporter substrate-binding protein [Streptomyces yangpuensis]MBZ9596480.1 ABC transporter substrate-binding protein [Streptomyces erythrochromogenes]UUY48364.1 ABC transporter substrate-binding protein [Streptomyces yangpuensis]
MTISRRAASLSRTFVATAMGASLVAGCGALPGGSAASGGPGGTITVMTFAPEGTKATNMPGMTGMAKAYERWVNAKGGINGHKLRVLTCNEKNTPSGAADCARKAVAEKAVAVVGSYSQHGRAFMAPLEAEGIPFIGGYGVSSEEFQSPMSYPVNGGQSVLIAGAGHQLGRVCDQVALVRPDTIPGDALPVLLNAGLRANKMADAADIRAAEDSADFKPQATEALAHTTGTGKEKEKEKGCVTAVLGERTETFFDAFRRTEPQRRKPQISSVLGSVSQSLVDRTGGRESPFEGAYITSWYPVSSDPVWEPMRKVVTEFAFGDDTVDPDDTGAQTTWIAYTVLSEIVKRFGKGEGVDARKVKRSLNEAQPVRTGGLTPDLSWRYQDMRAVAGFPRIVNGQVTFQIVQAGRLVAQPGEQSLDMTSTLEQAPRTA